MVRYILMPVAVLLLAIPALGQDRQEIIDSVLKPCWMHAVEQNPVEGVLDDQMLELMMLLQADQVDQVVTSVNTLLEHAGTTEERAAVLSMSRSVCINAIEK